MQKVKFLPVNNLTMNIFTKYINIINNVSHKNIRKHVIITISHMQKIYDNYHHHHFAIFKACFGADMIHQLVTYSDLKKLDVRSQDFKHDMTNPKI